MDYDQNYSVFPKKHNRNLGNNWTISIGISEIRAQDVKRHYAQEQAISKNYWLMQQSNFDDQSEAKTRPSRTVEQLYWNNTEMSIIYKHEIYLSILSLLLSILLLLYSSSCMKIIAIVLQQKPSRSFFVAQSISAARENAPKSVRRKQ